MQYVFLIISLLFFVFLLCISFIKEEKQHKLKPQKTQIKIKTQTPTITVIGRLISRAKQTNKIRFYGLYDWFY